MRLCKEHPFSTDGVMCERCGFCEDVFYADNQQEYEMGEDDEYY